MEILRRTKLNFDDIEAHVMSLEYEEKAMLEILEEVNFDFSNLDLALSVYFNLTERFTHTFLEDTSIVAAHFTKYYENI